RWRPARRSTWSATCSRSIAAIRRCRRAERHDAGARDTEPGMLNDPDARTGAQQRENAEPTERIRPIPLAAAAVTLAVVLFGVGYLLSSESLGNAALGDRRTVADLAGASAVPAQAADGKALYAAHCAACHQPNG